MNNADIKCSMTRNRTSNRDGDINSNRTINCNMKSMINNDACI